MSLWHAWSFCPEIIPENMNTGNCLRIFTWNREKSTSGVSTLGQDILMGGKHPVLNHIGLFSYICKIQIVLLPGINVASSDSKYQIILLPSELKESGKYGFCEAIERVLNCVDNSAPHCSWEYIDNNHFFNLQLLSCKSNLIETPTRTSSHSGSIRMRYKFLRDINSFYLISL